MFGIKIIKSGKYNELCQLIEELEKESGKIKADCFSLREQLNDAIRKIRELSVDQSSLVNYTVLHENNYKCERCKLESEDCKKLHFADRTICVCPKDKIISFKNNAKKTRK